MGQEKPASTAIKILYRPFAMVCSVAGGLIAAQIVQQIWVRVTPATAGKLLQPLSRSTKRGRSWPGGLSTEPSSGSSRPLSTVQWRGPSSDGRASGRGSERYNPRVHAHSPARASLWGPPPKVKTWSSMPWGLWGNSGGLSVAGAILEAADNSIQSKLTKLTGISLGVGSPPWPEAAHKETAAQTHQRHFFSSAPLICRVRRF